jgi:hypothetical protein
MGYAISLTQGCAALNNPFAVYILQLAVLSLQFVSIRPRSNFNGTMLIDDRLLMITIKGTLE